MLSSNTNSIDLVDKGSSDDLPIRGPTSRGDVEGVEGGALQATQGTALHPLRSRCVTGRSQPAASPGRGRVSSQSWRRRVPPIDQAYGGGVPLTTWAPTTRDLRMRGLCEATVRALRQCRSSASGPRGRRGPQRVEEVGGRPQHQLGDRDLGGGRLDLARLDEGRDLARRCARGASATAWRLPPPAGWRPPRRTPPRRSRRPAPAPGRRRARAARWRASSCGCASDTASTTSPSAALAMPVSVARRFSW